MKSKQSWGPSDKSEQFWHVYCFDGPNKLCNWGAIGHYGSWIGSLDDNAFSMEELRARESN